MLKPLGDRVVIEPDVLGNKSKGGIILPKALETLYKTGTIVAIGPGGRLSTMVDALGESTLSVKVGDKVMFESNVGTPIQFEGDEKEYILTRESYIAGIL